jgi:hypothetical protein
MVDEMFAKLNKRVAELDKLITKNNTSRPESRQVVYQKFAEDLVLQKNDSIRSVSEISSMRGLSRVKLEKFVRHEVNFDGLEVVETEPKFTGIELV